MERVALGSSDLRVSRLCMGTMTFGWTADEAASFAILDAYVEAGGNFLDSADVYSHWAQGNTGGESETVIGKWLKQRGNRAGMVIATKVRGRMWSGPTGEGLGREHILRACDDSLRRLGVETIDLYQCHWFDETVPFEESMRAFEELIRAGKVRFIGLSNYSPERLAEALGLAGAGSLPRIVSLQPHYNLLHRSVPDRDQFEGELQALCLQHGLGVIPYSPLAKGLLTGRYSAGDVQTASRSGVGEYVNDSTWEILAAVRDIAAKHEVPMAAVSLAWLMAQPGVTAPILGARTVAQLRDQLPAATLRLAPEAAARLNAVSLAPPS